MFHLLSFTGLYFSAKTSFLVRVWIESLHETNGNQQIQLTVSQNPVLWSDPPSSSTTNKQNRSSMGSSLSIHSKCFHINVCNTISVETSTAQCLIELLQSGCDSKSIIQPDRGSSIDIAGIPFAFRIHHHQRPLQKSLKPTLLQMPDAKHNRFQKLTLHGSREWRSARWPAA